MQCYFNSHGKKKKVFTRLKHKTKNSLLNFELTSPGLTIKRYHATYLTIYQRPLLHRPLCIAPDHHGRIWNQKTVISTKKLNKVCLYNCYNVWITCIPVEVIVRQIARLFNNCHLQNIYNTTLNSSYKYFVLFSLQRLT